MIWVGLFWSDRNQLSLSKTLLHRPYVYRPSETGHVTQLFKPQVLHLHRAFVSIKRKMCGKEVWNQKAIKHQVLKKKNQALLVSLALYGQPYQAQMLLKPKVQTSDF